MCECTTVKYIGGGNNACNIVLDYKTSVIIDDAKECMPCLLAGGCKLVWNLYKSVILVVCDAYRLTLLGLI